MRTTPDITPCYPLKRDFACDMFMSKKVYELHSTKRSMTLEKVWINIGQSDNEAGTISLNIHFGLIEIESFMLNNDGRSDNDEHIIQRR